MATTPEQARRAELDKLPLVELIKLRDEYGLKIDPTKSYDMADEIIKHERKMEKMRKAVWGQGAPFDAVADDTIQLNVDPREMKTQSADFIVNEILPEVLKHFFRKNAEYGDRHRKSRYGVKGELIGVDRKIDKLYEAIWNGRVMQFEQPKEMLYDMIGSCFLMLDLIAQEESDGT